MSADISPEAVAQTASDLLRRNMRFDAARAADMLEAGE